MLNRVLLKFSLERALNAVGVMSRWKIEDLYRQIVIDVARISGEMKLSKVENIVLVTAWAYDATLWMPNAHYEGIEGIRYIEKNP